MQKGTLKLQSLRKTVKIGQNMKTAIFNTGTERTAPRYGKQLFEKKDISRINKNIAPTRYIKKNASKKSQFPWGENECSKVLLRLFQTNVD